MICDKKKNDDGSRNQFPSCIHCGKTNHSKKYCFKAIGFPNWRKFGKRSGKQTNSDQSHSRGNEWDSSIATSMSLRAACAATVDGVGSPIPSLSSAQHRYDSLILSFIYPKMECKCECLHLPSRKPIRVGRQRNALYYLEPMRGKRALIASDSFNLRVKILRTDNGFEFTYDDLMTHYFDHGIEHQSSCTDTLQQNGVVERKHRHHLEVPRALRFQAHLLISFWGECVLTAAYLINHMPLIILQNKTPYEVLLRKSPTYDYLRSFGCLCYGHIINKPRDKFAPCAKPSVFVGYPSGQKGYRIYDLEMPNVTELRINESSTSINPTTSTIGPASHNHRLAIDEPMSQAIAHESTPIGSTSFTNSHESFSLATSVDPISSFGQLKLHPLSQFISYSKFSPNHIAFLAAISSIDELKSFFQAVKHAHWREAMVKEIFTLEANHTWTLQLLPPNKRAIDSKWVYKVKYQPDGSIKHYKAQLVAKGYT
ncbi:Uncharacterized protein TCM_025251 [Theobroma cacao]|uniref:Integrase catalytic domain-containing protein n=1 Tax=Theobroma cacao TaxID=3641 RepID=A0A061EZM0_THECC|nr:Uncharacterized protein TCM_025251 [Theobroma cacao]